MIQYGIELTDTQPTANQDESAGASPMALRIGFNLVFTVQDATGTPSQTWENATIVAFYAQPEDGGASTVSDHIEVGTPSGGALTWDNDRSNLSSEIIACLPGTAADGEQFVVIGGGGTTQLYLNKKKNPPSTKFLQYRVVLGPIDPAAQTLEYWYVDPELDICP